MLRFTLAVFLLLIPLSALCQEQPMASLTFAPATSPTPSPSTSAETLPLEQAIKLAIRDNPSLKRAALEIEMSGDRLAAATTRRLPSFELSVLESQTLTPLDFRFGRGVFGSYAGVGPIPSEDTKISTPRQPTMYLLAKASQPLSQLHRIGLGLKLEELRGKAAGERLRAEQQSVIRDVKRIYYELVSLQSAFESVEENIKLYRELNRVVGEYVAEKVALKADSLDVKTQLASEEYTALTLRDSLASQKEQLNALLGRDAQTDFSVTPMTDNIVYEIDLDAARARAREQRPEIREARLFLQQAELDQRVKKAEMIPDVSLAVTYMRIAPVSVIPQNIASVGVMLTWEPFDWGRKKRERAEKNKAVEQAKLAMYTAETRVTIEINALFRKLNESRALLRVSQFAQEAAREKLRVATNRFSEQSALLKDVLQGQAGVAEVSHKYQQALLAFWKARADFERAIGED
jgi:outer membrane protein TolC